MFRSAGGWLLALAAMTAARSAMAFDDACCDSWLGSQPATCVVRSGGGGACPAALPIEIALVEGESTPEATTPGSAECIVDAERSCCTESCAGSSASCPGAADALQPSCCSGYCGEVWTNDSGMVTTIYAGACPSTALLCGSPNAAACTPYVFQGVCFPGAMQLETIAVGPVVQSPVDQPTFSPEWTVTFGDVVPEPGGDAGGGGSVSVSGAGTGGGCAISARKGARGGDGAAGASTVALLAGMVLARRRGHAPRARRRQP